MGGAYSVQDVVEPRLDARVTAAPHLERLINTFKIWRLENVHALVTGLRANKEGEQAKELRKAGRIRWPELFKALEKLDFDVAARQQLERREKFHPACLGFAMTEKGALAESSAQSSAVKHQHQHQHQHQQHQQSEGQQQSGSTVEAAAGSGDTEVIKDEALEKELEAEAAIQAELAEREGADSDRSDDDEGGAEGSQGDNDGNDEEDEAEEDEEGDDDGAGEGQGSAGPESGYGVSRDMDARYTSPVFFGFTRESAETFDKRRAAAFERDWEELQVEDREEGLLANEEKEIRERHERRMNNLERERAAAANKLQKERGEARQVSKREKAAAKKAMADTEFRHFVRDMDKQDAENEKKWAAEDEERRKRHHIEDNEARQRLQGELAENAAKLASYFLQRHVPKGDKLVAQNLEIVAAAKDKAFKLKSEAALRRIEHEQAVKSAGNKADKNPHRGLIMVAEGEMRRAIADYEAAAAQLEADKIALAKARRLQAREARFVSLFYALVDTDADLGALAYSIDLTRLSLLLVVTCRVVLEKKLHFVFDMFCSRDADTLDEAQVAGVLRNTARVLEDVGAIVVPVTVAQKDGEENAAAAAKTEEAPSGKSKKRRDGHYRRRNTRRCPDAYVDSLAKRQFDVTRTIASRTMTRFEFTASMTKLVRVSEDLSFVFGVPWKYSNMSKWQHMRMSFVQKYELGMLTLEQLNKRIARLWVTHRKQLDDARKAELHERALAMGANDPLKPDYAKFLKKRKHRLQSNVEPLEHGSLGNIVHYEERLLYDSAMLVQCAWRAKVGRRRALREVKRRAFFSAWDDALNEAEAKVQNEFARREAQPAGGVGRMKWDAKVRMKQVKLRAKGQNLSREEVIQLLVQEDVAVAHEDVTKHFQAMKEERNIKSDEEIAQERELAAEAAREKTFREIVYTGVINRKEKSEKELLREGRREQKQLRREAEKVYLQRRALASKGWDPDQPETYELDELPAEEVKREDFVDLENLDYLGVEGNQQDATQGGDGGAHEGSEAEGSEEDFDPAIGPEDRVEGAAAGKKNEELEGEELQMPVDEDQLAREKLENEIKSKMQLIPSELPPVALPQPNLKLDTRASLMSFGAEIEAFYRVGLSEAEREMVLQLRASHPDPGALERRIGSIGTTMTAKKTEEFLQELPSKQLIIRFLDRYQGRPIAVLEHELATHFALLRREVGVIARGLRAVAQQDLRKGAMRQRAAGLVEETQKEVRKVSSRDLVASIKEIEGQEKAAAREARTKLENAQRRAKMEAGEESDDDDDDEDDEENEDAENEENELKDLDKALTESPAGQATAPKPVAKFQGAQRAGEEKDGEQRSEEVSIEERARTATEDRKRRVIELRNVVLKAMKDLEVAELELERSERNHRGFMHRENKRMDACLEGRPEMATASAEELGLFNQVESIGKPVQAAPPGPPQPDEGANKPVLKRGMSSKLSAQLKRSVSFLKLHEAEELVSEEARDAKAAQEKAAAAERNLSWQALREAARIRTLGIGSLGTEKAGDWYHRLELADVDMTNESHRYNWMERYRAILALDETSQEARLEKYLEMFNLMDEFKRAAESFGKVIILERFLPDSRKSILPVRARDADVGRGDQRVYFKVANIHFKFAIDDDGLCNGSDEHAAKYHGNAIRNAVAFLKVRPERVLVPFEAMVEYNGTRLQATAHAPVELRSYDNKGNLKREDTELVLGSEDRGKTIKNDDKSLDRMLQAACAKLSLVSHGVKGEKDLLPKYLSTPADMRGFRDFQSPTFYLLNFRRLFPPEDSDQTPHLPRAPRGHSIFWRQLRPELVKAVGLPQSSDAFSLFTLDTPDWRRHAAQATEATRRLVQERIPAYAEELALRPEAELADMDLTQEMHARGINMRHLGLLRSLFWRQVRGTVQVTFSERVLTCSHDVTKEVKRGQPIRLRNERFRVSRDLEDPFDGESRTICIEYEENEQEDGEDGDGSGGSSGTGGVNGDADLAGDEKLALRQKVPLYSSYDEVMFTGCVGSEANSRRVRAIILGEMLARTFKNLARCLMREVCEQVRAPSEVCMERALVHMLNLISGAGAGSDAFWTNEVIAELEERYGRDCLSQLEKLNLRVHVENDGVLFVVVERFLAAFEARLSDTCAERFRASCGAVKDCACSFLFSIADLRDVRCRVKHNMHLLEFCKGVILSTQAHVVQTTTYESVVLEDRPSGYWPLGERTGSKIAINRGVSGLRLSGKVFGTKCGIDGHVKNHWPNRAMHFPLFRRLEEDSDGEGGDNAPAAEKGGPPRAEGEAPDSTWRRPKIDPRLRAEKEVEYDSSDEAATSDDAEGVDDVAEAKAKAEAEAKAGAGAGAGIGDEEGSCGDAQNDDDGRPKRRTSKSAKDPRKGGKGKGKMLYLAKAKIDIPFHASVVPTARTQPFSIEAWVRAGVGDGKERYIAQNGRFSLRCGKAQAFAFTMHDAKYAVTVWLQSEPQSLDGKWHHLVGTYDGAVASFYVDSLLVDRVNYDDSARALSRGYAMRQAQDERTRREEELKQRKAAAAAAREESRAFFKSKAGQITMSSTTKRLMARSEARIKLNREKARILGIKPLTAADARKMAVEDWVRKRTAEHLEKITEKHRKIIARRKELRDRKHQQAEQHALRALRLGAGIASTGAPKGCFSGDAQHIAVYQHCLTRDTINRHFLVAKSDLSREAERLYNDAAELFEQSLVRCYDEDLVLSCYSEAMTRRATVDSDRTRDAGKFRLKILRNLKTFENKSNARGIASLLVSMPDLAVYGPVVVECWRAINRVAPLFFAEGTFHERKRRLWQLENVPERFSLAAPAARRVPSLLETAAEMYRFVLEHCDDYYGGRVGPLPWIARLRSPELVCYLVGRVKVALDRLNKQLHFKRFVEEQRRLDEIFGQGAGEVRSDVSEAERDCQRCLLELDLRECRSIDPDELQILGDNLRVMEEIDLQGCMRLDGPSLEGFVAKCSYLLSLGLADCSHAVGDSVLLAIAEHCTSLRRLDVRKCHQVSDVGVVAVARSCPGLKVLLAAHCEQLSDAGLAESGKLLRRLEELDVSWCVLVSNAGLNAFGAQGPQRTLRRLRVSGCRRLDDEGMAAIGRLFTHLVHLDVSFCNKVTNRGGIALTHGLLDLQELDLSDLYQVSDKAFFYDAIGDGRAMADDRMLAQLRDLRLAGCKYLTNHGVAEIARRAERLERLNVNGCERLTDEAITALTRCPVTSVRRGERLVALDLAFCGDLSGASLGVLGEHCPQLQAITLTGCSRLQDKHLRKLCIACSGLQSVDVAHCKRLTDATVEAMCEYLWVEELDIAYCNKMTDRAIALVAEYFSGMTRLRLSWCRKITDASVALLADSCQWLRRLDVVGCDALSPEVLERVLDANPSCEVIRK